MARSPAYVERRGRSRGCNTRARASRAFARATVLYCTRRPASSFRSPTCMRPSLARRLDSQPFANGEGARKLEAAKTRSWASIGSSSGTVDLYRALRTCRSYLYGTDCSTSTGLAKSALSSQKNPTYNPLADDAAQRGKALQVGAKSDAAPVDSQICTAIDAEKPA